MKNQSKIKNRNNKSGLKPGLLGFSAISVAFLGMLILAQPALAIYSPGETLNPSCSPGEAGCTVVPPAASGANSDITSLSGLTTALSISQGGTGVSSIGADGQILKVSGGKLVWANDAGGASYTAGSGLNLSGATFSLDLTQANTWSGIQTFGNGFKLGGNTYTDLVGTGLSFTSGTLSTVLGTSIESSEITNGEIVNEDLANATLTFAKLSQNSCASGEIIKWNGSAWACAVDDGEVYTAGTGLALNSNEFALEINGLTVAAAVDDADTLAIYDDSEGEIRKITRANLLSGVTGALVYQGTWDATSNSPSLTDGTGAQGQYYVVDTAGSQDLGSGSISYTVGDWVIHNGTTWEKLDSTNDVQSVFGRTGIIVASTSDYDALQIDNTAAGNISSTNVQDALNELDTEKASATLNSGLIFVGNSSNLATGVALSGDATIDNLGVLTIGSDAVALGDDTTGNYLATLEDSGESIFTIANSGTENAAVTLALADDVLDFTKLSDTLTLDAGTSVTLGGNDFTLAITAAGRPKLTRTSAGEWLNLNDGTDSFSVFNYAGTPEGNLTADIGSLAIDTSSGRLYIKTTDGTNTDWSEFSSAEGIFYNSDGTLDSDRTITSGGYDLTFAGTGGDIVMTDDGYLGIGTDSPTFKLALSGTASEADRKIGINGIQVLYLPDQDNYKFLGSLAIGDGLTSLETHLLGAHGHENTAVGIGALYANTTGQGNTAGGNSALYSNTAGNYNTAQGIHALYTNTTGNSNVALGTYALHENISGGNNSALGAFALRNNTTGSYNTALGLSAGGDNVSSSNSLYLGARTKALADGDTNEIVIGYNATGIGSNSVVLGNDDIATTALKGKVGIGTTSPTTALEVNGGTIRVVGSTATGSSGSILSSNATGGYYSLYNAAGNSMFMLYDGSNNVQLANVYGNILLTGGNVGISTTDPGSYKLYVAGNAYSTGTWGTSDARWKTDVVNLEGSLEKITQLRGVNFNWKKDKYPEMNFDDGLQVGLIAQELEQVFPELVKTGEDGYKAVAYDKLGAVLIEAIKEQQTLIDANSGDLAAVGLNLQNLVSAKDGQTVFKGTLAADTLKANKIEGLDFATGSEMDALEARLTAYDETLNNISEQLALLETQTTDEELALKVEELEVSGGVIFKSEVEFQGPAIFLAIAEFLDRVIFNQPVEFKEIATYNADTAGYAKILKGQTQIEIKFEKEYETVPVVNVTPQGIYAGIQYAVTEVSSRGFVIEIDPKQETDVLFSWSAIAVQGVKIQESEAGEDDDEEEEEDEDEDDDKDKEEDDDDTEDEKVDSETEDPVDDEEEEDEDESEVGEQGVNDEDGATEDAINPTNS